jgi:hypothetical protein
MCDEALSEISAHIEQNGEPSIVLWSNRDCQGTRYPSSITTQPEWESIQTLGDMGLHRVRSIYVPPHAVLRTFAVDTGRVGNGTPGVREIVGPYHSSSLDTDLIFWESSGILPVACSDGVPIDNECGNPIQWTSDSIASVQHYRHRLWDDFVKLLCVFQNQTIEIGGHESFVNCDYVFNQKCSNDSKYCGCWDDWNTIKSTYPKSYPNLPPNIFGSTCLVDVDYYPSDATVSLFGDADCQKGFRFMIENNEKPRLEDGVDTIYCNGSEWKNANDDGTDYKSSQTDKNETREEESFDNDALLWTLVAVFLFLIIITVYYWLVFKSRPYRTRISNSVSKTV